MQRAFLSFLITISLVGQSTQPSASDTYATTDDGSQLFLVSTPILRGSTGETTTPKLFKYDGANFSLAIQIPFVFANNNPNFYALLSPRISGDGSVVGYVATQGCGNSCTVAGGYQTTLQFPGTANPVTLPYYCQISRNAKYALCVTAQPSPQQVVIVNLSTMQMSAPQSTACHGRNLITSDGRALAWDEKNISLFNATSTQQIASDSFGCPAISDDGSVIVYPSHQGLTVYRVSSGSITHLTPACTSCTITTATSITNDGSIVLDAGTLYRTDGSSTAPFSGNLLSGNGLVGYQVINDYQPILKIDVTSGATTQISQPAPLFAIGLSGFFTPGSYYLLQGSSLSTTSEGASSLPAPTTLAGVQVKINGSAAPVLAVSPTSVAFQLPWETPLYSATLEVTTSTTSQFVSGPFSLSPQPYAPRGLGEAINENFTAVNSRTNPANPGDIVNFYLSGLGAGAVTGGSGILSRQMFRTSPRARR